MHTSSKGLGQHLVWLAVAVLGAFALGTVALARGAGVAAAVAEGAAVAAASVEHHLAGAFDPARARELRAAL